MQLQINKAECFQALHAQENVFLIPNAWDALSAKLFEQAGAPAIATTSAGIAAILGYPDGERIPKALLLTIIERIVASVNIPVSVDIEAGFSELPTEIGGLVDDLLTIGVVGINLEDADPGCVGELFSIEAQVEKIIAIRDRANKRNIPLFINARTDTYWQRLYDPRTRQQETLRRLLAYEKAGADGVFVPGLNDQQLVTEITNTIKLPLNLLAGAWVDDLQILKSWGVARLSIGSAAIRDVAQRIKKQAKQLLQHDNFQCFDQSFTYTQLQQLFENIQ